MSIHVYQARLIERLARVEPHLIVHDIKLVDGSSDWLVRIGTRPVHPTAPDEFVGTIEAHTVTAYATTDIEKIKDGSVVLLVRACREIRDWRNQDVKPAVHDIVRPSVGWACPKCGGAHGPAVRTCPVDNRTLGERLGGGG